MTLFEFKDARAYLRDHISRLPKKGRGELSRIAAYLRINTTLLSQIMSGSRNFTFEQALELSQYLGHTDFETDYFTLLIQRERAGTVKLRDHLDGKIKLIQEESRRLSKRIASEKTLSPTNRSIFYSSWLYSAVHLFTSIRAAGVSLEEIAGRFEISRAKAVEITRFLSACGLCKETKGRFIMGTQSTFIEQGSPHLLKHHANWRIKAIQKSESLNEHEMMYTGQVSLSKADYAKIREELADFLKRTMRTVKDSPAEEIACLNIDWFWLGK